MSETATDSEPFADDTPLVRLFGTPARTRILSVFVDEREFDLTITEVAEQAGVARSTVYEHIDDLVALGVIAETRQTGSSTRYRLSRDDPIAEHLYRFDGLVLQRLLDVEGQT